LFLISFAFSHDQKLVISGLFSDILSADPPKATKKWLNLSLKKRLGDFLP
jgi:hypothetical protein